MSGLALNAASTRLCLGRVVQVDLDDLDRAADSPNPSVKPRQRSSSAALPTSWLTQIAFVTPASPIRCPAPRPASYSVWPTWVSRPNSAATSLPSSSR